MIQKFLDCNGHRAIISDVASHHNEEEEEDGYMSQISKTFSSQPISDHGSDHFPRQQNSLIPNPNPNFHDQPSPPRCLQSGLIMRRYSPPYYSPPRRGYGGRTRSPPRRGHGGGGYGTSKEHCSFLVQNIPLSCSQMNFEFHLKDLEQLEMSTFQEIITPDLIVFSPVLSLWDWSSDFDIATMAAANAPISLKEVLTEAFSLCNSNVIELIDDVPILQIDMVWCYFMLRDISWLSVAGVHLSKARQGLERAYGKNTADSDSSRAIVFQKLLCEY